MKKLYVITYEWVGGGFGCREYGIHKVCRGEKSAQNLLAKLSPKPGDHRAQKVEYKLQIIDLDSKDPQQLFQYNY